MKKFKIIVGIAAALVAVAAAVTLVIAYRDRIKGFLDSLMEKAAGKKDVIRDPECADFADFADI